jgi:TonB family protein
MDALTLRNLIALSAQIGGVGLAALLVFASLRVNAPGLQYAYWRAVALLCLLLPWVQAARPADPIAERIIAAGEASAVTAPAGAAAAAPAIDWAWAAGVVLASGVALRLLWIAAGLIRLRRLRRSGASADAAHHAHLQSMLRVSADVRYSTSVEQPVAFGVMRPVVLLPERLREAPPAIRDAVIAHELLHVRRRDWLCLVAEEIVGAAFWFHPAMWWLIARVQLAREEVVDAAVVALTGRRREYIEALLAFADDMPLAPAPAFARRRHLFRRIMQVSREDVMSARRLVVSAVVMIVALGWGALAAIGAFPMQGSTVLQQTPGPLEQLATSAGPTNPIPVRLSSVMPVFPPQGADATCTLTFRAVIDAGGSVAELRLTGVTLGLPGVTMTMTMSDSVGLAERMEAFSKARFRTNPDQPPFDAASARATLEAFIDAASQAVHQWRFEPPKESPLAFDVTISFAKGNVGERLAASRATARATTVDPSGAVRVGGNVRTPTKIKDVRPMYPPEAREAGVQGVVIAEVHILPDGRVGSASILRSIPMLDAAALEAIQQWEFTPTLLNGVPTPVIMTVTVQFTLQ